MTNDLKEGASASINKTINDIEQLLQGHELPPEGKLRQKLRNQLNDVLSIVASEWLEHGFIGGHVVSAKRFMATGEFPKIIKTTVTRKFPVRSVGKETVEIALKSKLKKELAAKLDAGA